MSFLVLSYALLGLVVGSFLNVCIYRIPRRESVVRPRSRCPHCGTLVRPYDNVPVLSYLWLGGRCRFCKNNISLRYPAVELLAGLAFYTCAVVWGFSAPTFVNSLFLCLIAVLVFIDYEHQILPNTLTLPGSLAGVILSPFQSASLFQDALLSNLASALSPASSEAALPWVGSPLGLLVGGGVLLLFGSAYQVLRKKQGLGMGDVKMMAMVGSFLGWRLALLTIFFGSVLGTIVGIFLILFRGRSLQARLAFGTFLGIGAVISLFFGISFLQWYAYLT